MRVLVVDQDSTMLEAIVRALSEHFAVDVVTNKGDCIDLLRVNEYEVVVACERLADGSGLELLGQIAKRWPATLRIFAADRERLRLLQGKLGPFELFQTVSYPIDPRKLFAALALANAAQNADADTTNIQHVVLGGDDIEEETAAPDEPPPKAPPPAQAPMPVPAVRVVASRRARSVPAAQPSVAPPAARERPAPQARRRRQSEPAVRATQFPPLMPAPPPISTGPEPFEPQSRVGFIIGAGAAVVLGAILFAVKFFGADHGPTPPSTVAAARQPHFSREVTDLVARIEADFKQDDFRSARTDVANLRETAPGHPRLPFFEKLLSDDGNKHPRKSTAAVSATARKRTSAEASSVTQAAPQEVAPQTQTTTQAPQAASPGAAGSSTPTAPSAPEPAAPAPPAPAPAAATVASTPSKIETGTSFTGRTVEGSDSPPTPIPASVSAGSNSPPRRGLAPPPGTREAQLVHRVEPEYPASAARRGIEGWVEVRFSITVEGAVENLSIASASPPDVFDRAAMEAVSRWRYDPRVVDDKPVESPAQVRLDFKLDPNAK